jgi:nitric oxide reductase NorD protein
MEEQIGQLWHGIITRLANSEYPQACVELKAVQRPLAIYFRALGGDAGLQIEAADSSAGAYRHGWLQRLAGVRQPALAWKDERSLRLPLRLCWFADRDLNRDLYYWLAALAAQGQDADGDWLSDNQQRTRQTLQRFSGLAVRYDRLLAAHLQHRPAPTSLAPDEAAAERALRRALSQPGSVDRLPEARHAPHPVPLWLHPCPRPVAGGGGVEDEAQQTRGQPRARQLDDVPRRRAERSQEAPTKAGLLAMRMENILSWGEQIHLDRSCDDEEDLDRAEAVARDLDQLTVSRHPGRVAPLARLRFDLDLPAEAEDDQMLDDGMRLPEWDWRRQCMQPHHCRLSILQTRQTTPQELPRHLRPIARRLRQQFQHLAPARCWQRNRSDGEEVDMEAYLRYRTDRAVGVLAGSDRLYRQMLRGRRDLACLLMADLSLSTDSWINDQQRVIDVIRDSLHLFAESLSATGDPHALFGFSSRRQNPVRIHRIKDFGERQDGRIRGRIQAIKPGYYTRMGAAVRFASAALSRRPEGRRLLLLLTDGKPNDIDQYEGRYGIEDTRRAILEARQSGLEPFCVTIDTRASDYLPYLFGSHGFVMVRKAAELPLQLPLLYARLTA